MGTSILILGEPFDLRKSEILQKAFIINAPGEYEIKEAFIQGISREEKKSVVALFVIKLDSLTIVHLGGAASAPLSEALVEELSDVDILLIPVGGKGVLGAEEAEKIFSQLEPKVVIPMAYKIPSLKVPREGVQKFEKLLGHETPKPLPKIVLKKKDLSPDESRVVILEPQ